MIGPYPGNECRVATDVCSQSYVVVSQDFPRAAHHVLPSERSPPGERGLRSAGRRWRSILIVLQSPSAGPHGP